MTQLEAATADSFSPSFGIGFLHCTGATCDFSGF